jgi:hypothetical protein
MIYCQDSENEPPAIVMLHVDTQPKSSMDTNDFREPFVCYECLNCQEKSNLTIRHCQMGINMCFVNLIPEIY